MLWSLQSNCKLSACEASCAHVYMVTQLLETTVHEVSTDTTECDGAKVGPCLAPVTWFSWVVIFCSLLRL